MNRKEFLRLSSMGLASLPLSPFTNHVAAKPLIISTWDSGMPVNAAGWKVLSARGSALDAVEAGARYIEDTVDCCVGLDGYPDRDGIVTLDACIMDDLANCGAVAGLEKIRHPISVARRVMEKTPHVLLVGQGAQQFALENGFTLEDGKLSPSAEKAYKQWLIKSEYKPVINIERKDKNGPYAPAFFDNGQPNHDTMGILALDQNLRLAGAVTTSGMAFKIHGRVGDSAIAGAGLFVDREAGAATSSGVGEEVIRICGTHLVVEFMRMGLSPQDACKKAVERIVSRDREKAKVIQVGFLALGRDGSYGAYAIQKGFVFSVKSDTEERIIASPHLL